MVAFAQLEALLRAEQGASYGEGASEGSIAEIENSLGVRIVGGYRSFLRCFGWISVGSIEVNGVGPDVPSHLDLLKITLSERYEMGPPLPLFLLPLLNDGAGNNYCLDTASTVGGDNPVVFWDHELDSDQESEQVSPSFHDWLSIRIQESR